MRQHKDTWKIYEHKLTVIIKELKAGILFLVCSSYVFHTKMLANNYI